MTLNEVVKKDKKVFDPLEEGDKISVDVNLLAAQREWAFWCEQEQTKRFREFISMRLITIQKDINERYFVTSELNLKLLLKEAEVLNRVLTLTERGEYVITVRTL